MRILHVAHQYPPDYIGGVELYTQTVARATAALGHAVAVFTHDAAVQARGQEPPRLDDALEIQSAQSAPLSANRRFLATFGHAAAARSFAQMLDHFQPELVHIQHLMGLPTTLVQELQARHIPFLVTLHDYWWVCANAQLITNDGAQICSGPDAIGFNCTRCAVARAGAPAPTVAASLAAPLVAPLLAQRNRLLRNVLQQAAHIVTPTRFVADWYQAHGVSADRLHVLPLGVERPTQLPPKERCDHNPLRLTYMGGLTWQKGIHRLLAAFEGVQGDVELWIGGNLLADPAYSRTLQNLAGPSVRFLGQLDRQQVWQTLAQSDLVVVPSLWYESFSLLAHEAFAAGVPVLASDLGALAEVVRDGVDGLLAAPGDITAWQAAMQKIVDNPGQLSSLRAGIRPPWTVAQHVARLIEIYESMHREVERK